jgi:hypothetical protein
MSDDLLNRATENVSERVDGDWGYRVALDPDETFLGRWRGETTTSTDYGEQPVYLLWDQEGAECYLYGGRVDLDRKIRAAAPIEGDSIGIARGEDESANGRTVHRFGIATETNMEPLPTGPPEVDW